MPSQPISDRAVTRMVAITSSRLRALLTVASALVSVASGMEVWSADPWMSVLSGESRFNLTAISQISWTFPRMVLIPRKYYFFRCT